MSERKHSPLMEATKIIAWQVRENDVDCFMRPARIDRKRALEKRVSQQIDEQIARKASHE